MSPYAKLLWSLYIISIEANLIQNTDYTTHEHSVFQQSIICETFLRFRACV